MPITKTRNCSCQRDFEPFSIISDSAAPPRPPLPADGGFQQAPPPARPPPPPALDTTDDESEDLFQNAPTASQGPIMVWINL